MPDKPLPSAATLFKAPLPKAESLFRAPARAAAPAKPVKPAPKPKQESGFSKGFGEFGNTVGRAFQSAPGSAEAAAAGLYGIVRHPIKSANSAASIAAGGLYNAGIPRPPSWMMADPGEYDRDRKHASGFAQGYKDRYGSMARIKHTFETDPIGMGLDALMLEAPVRGLARRSGAVVRGSATAGRVKAAAQRTFAPETVSEAARDTATLHRAAHGVQRGQAAAEAYALERHQRVVGNSTPAEQAALAKHVDTGGKEPIPDKLKPAARTMRGVYTRYQARIENVLDPSDRMKFVENYYARFWKQSPDAVAKAIGGRQGSGRNLRKRSIPTYQEGLDAGLTPVFTNPLDATHAYTDNMATYLATHETLNGMRGSGLAKWAYEGKVPKGSVVLEGIGTSKPAMLNAKGALIPKRVLVAPEDAARVYNRTVSKGLDQGAFAPLYRGARAASNAITQLKLGFSAFHATVMGEEGFTSAFAKGADQVLRGDIKGGLKALGASPAAAYRTAAKGGALRRAILDPDNAAVHLKGMEPKLAEMYQRSGGRVNMDRFYSTGSVSGGFYRSLANGTFTREFTQALGEAKAAPIKGTLGLFGKIMDTVSAPIFKEYVPRMKAGAWASRMEQWLRDNPEASATEQQRYGENLVNNMDNRFGELIQDNQFWDKAHFQTAQLLMLSPSWNFGTVREIGGGLAELPKSLKMVLKGKGVTDKTAYVASLATTYMLQNGIATYLHTGQMPEGYDWLAYRTGGTDAKGLPQRGFLPTYMKDVLAFTHDFPHNVAGEIENKANPALTLATGAVTNRDYQGKAIYNPAGGVAEQAGELAAYGLQEAAPISLSQRNLGAGNNLSAAERAAGIRQAPGYIEDPEGTAANKQKYGERDWKASLKAKAKRDAANTASTTSALPKAESLFTAPLPKAESLFKAPEGGGRMKPGAMMPGAAFRPEFKPVVALVGAVPGIRELTGGNDAYHKGGAHLDGRGADFNLEPGAQPAQVVARIRAKLKAAGYSNVRVLDEYSHPSRNATGGHIHVEYR